MRSYPNYILLSFFLLLTSGLTAQTPHDDSVVVETMPQFPGGETAMMNFLTENLQYPQEARNLGIQGKVYVSFVVDTSGAVINVELLRGIGGGCDEEAIRVVKLMPRWTPGKQNGRLVKVQYRMPIQFTLNTAGKKKKKGK